MKLETKDGKILEGTRAVVRAGCFDGEVIVVALEANYADHRRAHPGKVLYAWPELPIVRELRRTNPESLKLVHELKREFRGWITPKKCEGFGQPQALPPGSPRDRTGPVPGCTLPLERGETRMCVDCGRPYSNSKAERCLECEVLVNAGVVRYNKRTI